MKTILFSKMLKEKTPEELVKLALTWGIDGYDLCVRPGYPVNPDNALEELPKVVKLFRANNLDVPMVTGNFDLLAPDHPTARPILQAMDKADVHLVKLGYFKFDPKVRPYFEEVDRIRGIFAQWEPLAREYGVKICYHTHSGKNMGLNASGLAHLLAGFDRACLGAYLDAGHLAAEGEAFPTAVAMVRPYLSIVAVKDVLLTRVEKNGHGSIKQSWVEAGQGVVDWTQVFETLEGIKFAGPISIHCEFKIPEAEFLPAATREIAFFKKFTRK